VPNSSPPLLTTAALPSLAVLLNYPDLCSMPKTDLSWQMQVFRLPYDPQRDQTMSDHAWAATTARSDCFETVIVAGCSETGSAERWLSPDLSGETVEWRLGSG
jgi:hypothetical protein